MIRARCHFSAWISGSNSVKSQLIFINRQYNFAHSCVKNTIPRELIHSHSLRQWFGEKLAAVFWLIHFFRAQKIKGTEIHNIFMTCSSGEKVGPPATKYLGNSLRNLLDSVYSTEKVVVKRARAQRQRWVMTGEKERRGHWPGWRSGTPGNVKFTAFLKIQHDKVKALLDTALNKTQ